MKRLIALITVVGLCAAMAFAGNFVYNPEALINIADLTTATAYQNYPLGSRVMVQNYSNTGIKEYVYVYATTALSAYNIYNIVFSSAPGQETCTGTPSNSAAVAYMSGVAPSAFTAGSYGFLQTGGDATVYATTNTTVGNCGRIVNALTTVTDIGSTTVSTTTVGLWKTQRYGTGTATMYLLNKQTYVY